MDNKSVLTKIRNIKRLSVNNYKFWWICQFKPYNKKVWWALFIRLCRFVSFLFLNINIFWKLRYWCINTECLSVQCCCSVVAMHKSRHFTKHSPTWPPGVWQRLVLSVLWHSQVRIEFFFLIHLNIFKFS